MKKMILALSAALAFIGNAYAQNEVGNILMAYTTNHILTSKMAMNMRRWLTANTLTVIPNLTL